MKKHLAVILSILLALGTASPVSAAKLKKNQVENIAAREEQAAMDAVSGPAAGETGDKPSEVTGNNAPGEAVHQAEAPAGEEQEPDEAPTGAEQETEASAESAQETEAPAGTGQETEPQEVERGEKGTYLGTFTTTGYSNPDGSASADGTMPRAQHTVSADWNVLPPGTRIRFGDSDIIYTVEDTGVHGNWVDVYYPTHSEAWSHGLKYKEVYRVD